MTKRISVLFSLKSFLKLVVFVFLLSKKYGLRALYLSWKLDLFKLVAMDHEIQVRYAYDKWANLKKHVAGTDGVHL